MAQHSVDQIRNIVLCGHGASGKTTLADKFLMTTGTAKGQHSVDDHTSICDFDEVEKHHKYTIETKVTHFQHAGLRFNVLDTPGYPDFIGQTISAMRAVETAAIVIDAHSGIAVNTRRVFKEAGAAGLGRIIVINKMDAENVDYKKLLNSIGETFGHSCVPLNVPVGHGHDFKGVVSTLHPPADTSGALVDVADVSKTLVESIIEMDDAVTEQYFEGKMPSDQELSRLAIAAVASGHLIPIIAVSGKTGSGIKELLDALALCGLPPTAIERKAKKDAAEATIQQAADAPLAALVFKTRIDPFVQKLSYIRIYGGTLKKDASVSATGARKGTKLTQLFEVQANETTPVDSASAGDIVAVIKAEDLHVNTSIGDFVFPPIVFPKPMVGLAVTPKSRGDETKLSGALHKIVEEDPTVHFDPDPQTKELVMTGMSELHLMVVRERLKRRDKVEVDTHEPKIPYRETIQVKAEGSYRHKKQTGGRGQFGEVHIRMFPMPEGTKVEDFATKERFSSMKDYHYDPKHNFLWVNSVVGGTIPSNFLPAIEKGFKERIERGVIAGYQVQNVCVEVHFGKHHDVDSSEAAFKTAGSMAFRNVFQQAKPALLEPIVKIFITVPGDKLGDINSDMSGRRGRVLGMDSAGGDMQTVIAEVPLSEVTTYARSLSSLTGGQGSFTMEFNHYDVVPGNVQKEIIDKTQLKEEEEE